MILRGGLGYFLVLVGGLVVSVLPPSGPVAGLPLLEDLRASMPGRMLGLSVVVLGLGLGVAAWLELVRYVARRDRRTDAVARGLVHRATVWWTAPLLVAPAMFSRDGWSYAAQGELTRLGLSPYVWAPSVLEGPVVEAVDPRWMDTLTPYGPVPLVWGGLVAEVTGSPWLMVVGHRVLAVAGLLLLGYAVPRMAAWAGRDPVLASALVLPSPVMLAHGVAGLHNDLLMVGLMALAVVVAVEHGWTLGAVLVGLAAAVKLPGGLAGVGVALATLRVTAGRGRRVRRLTSVAAVSIGTLVAVGLVSGLGVGWVHALGVPGEVLTPLSLPTQTGRLVGLLLAPLETGLTTDSVVSAARTLGSLAALVFAGWVALRAPTGVPAAAVRALGLVMLVLVVLGPVVHHWYLLWCLPLLATCHLGSRAGAALLHASWLFGLVAPLDSSLRGAGTVIALGVGLVAVVALVQLLVHRANGAVPGAGVRPEGRADYPASSAAS
ncbi:MAG: polyprenol phosphomannose-dependent alpha 1,6 mannosyltransferase MptB [Actinomycetota bacterium]